MTDRGRSALRQSNDTFTVGPSQMHWTGDSLIIDVNEISVPHIDRVTGQIRLYPAAITPYEVPLHETGRHVWRPFAPTARVEVALNRSGWNWSGHGYFDANFGTAALEDDFSYWTWGRFPVSTGTVCFYDAIARDGSDDLAVALKFTGQGEIESIPAPPKVSLSRSLWAVKRETRADPGTSPKQTKHMLDAPFYCRAGVETKINGETSRGVYEALDLNRFRSPWLKPMLAVKVPRRAAWKF